MDPEWKDTTRPSKTDATDSEVYGSNDEAILSIRQNRLGFKADLPDTNKLTKITLTAKAQLRTTLAD